MSYLNVERLVNFSWLIVDEVSIDRPTHYTENRGKKTSWQEVFHERKLINVHIKLD